MDEETIGAIVRNRENNYINGNTQLSKYVNFSMYENLEKIEAYTNSKHISGDVDDMGRDKPFFNIVTSAINVWYRSTKKSTKDIRLKSPDSSSIFLTYLANIKVQNWMKEEQFGVFLKRWGRSLAKYGSSVPKFVEQDGKLSCQVVPWSSLIVDSINFNNDVIIEKLYLTPSQLRKRKGYDQDKVEKLIDSTRESRKLIDRQQQDTLSEFIPIYEVHGELPLSMLKVAKGEEPKEGDEDIYVQQMHVISFCASKGKKDDYDEFTLACGREKQSPYMITHLIEEDGRTQAIGAVEHLFETQWMQNHTAKAIKDQLDFASLIILQTADGSFQGQNAFDSMATGDFLIHADNQPITQVQNNSHDITALQSFAAQWKALGQEITSTPDPLLGKNPPAGTPWRLNQDVISEGHSLYEIMNESKDLAIEDMMRRFIIPHILTTLDTTEEISATLDQQGISKIDSMYIKAEVIRRNNAHMAEQMFNHQVATPLDTNALTQNLQSGLNDMGTERFFKPSDINTKTWKQLFKDFTWHVTVETPENTNKDAILTTLTTVLQTIATNPSVLSDPNAKSIFNKILIATGEMNPIEFTHVTPPAPTPSPIAPSPTPVQPAS